MLGDLTCITPSCRPRELGLLKIPIMQVRKPRPGELQPLAQVHAMNKRPTASNHRDPKAQALNRPAHCLTVMRPGVGEDAWGPRMEDGVQGEGRRRGPRRQRGGRPWGSQL